MLGVLGECQEIDTGAAESERGEGGTGEERMTPGLLEPTAEQESGMGPRVSFRSWLTDRKEMGLRSLESEWSVGLVVTGTTGTQVWSSFLHDTPLEGLILWRPRLEELTSRGRCPLQQSPLVSSAGVPQHDVAAHMTSSRTNTTLMQGCKVTDRKLTERLACKKRLCSGSCGQQRQPFC